MNHSAGIKQFRGGGGGGAPYRVGPCYTDKAPVFPERTAQGQGSEGSAPPLPSPGAQTQGRH